MIKAERLRPGDTIGIISPSSALAGLLPHRLESAIANLESMGYKVRLGKNATKVTGYTAGSPEERADDIHAMFLDDEVSAIMCAMGGFHANQVINKLDYELIAAHPKIFVGFSDISVLHFALFTQSKLVTFYGPTAIAQFGGVFGVDPYTQENFLKAVAQPNPIGAITASTDWTEEMLDWFSKKDLERPQKMLPNTGYSWVCEGAAQGELIGGCITSILHLRGTKYWPDFGGKIFFWELPESSADMRVGEPLSRIDAHLTDLELSGVFDQIAGMVIGRPRGYSEDEAEKLKDVVLKYIGSRNIPTVFNINIGHTDPITTLPLGVRAQLDSENNLFSVVEAGVECEVDKRFS